MGNVQLVGPNARRKTAWVIGVTTIVGLLTILGFAYFQDQLHAWLARHIDFLVENTIVVFVVALAFVSPLFAAAIYLFLLGKRTVRAQRFPPPGYALYRETPVLEGMRGVRRGRIIQSLSLFLICSAAAIPVIIWYLFRSLGSAM